MASASVPAIPPRPARSQKEHRSTMAGNDVPKIPPRPARRTDRSMSPHRDTFAPSPLNESSFAVNSGGAGGGHPHLLYSSSSAPPGSTSLQAQPNLTLPSIGQEGTEYATFYGQLADEPASNAPPPTQAQETRNVAKDLELHAPKPALPTSSAKARIATVTRTDSSQAAAAGIGKAHADDADPHARSLKARASFASSSSSTPALEQGPPSQAGEVEHGIPEIGQRVPMYPHAGDVQAPSPSPFLHGGAAAGGHGVAGEGQQHRAGRHHGRTRSGREYFHLPPGSYGLHGHGMQPFYDRFEKEWYEKHPDALEREEHGEYGPGLGGRRGEWALSREELDRLVRETASKGAGVGTSPAVLGTPNEEIGYIASEEYVAKQASSRPSSTARFHGAYSEASPAHAESRLRETSFPADTADDEERSQTPLAPEAQGTPAETSHSVEGTEDDNVIHVEPHSHRHDKSALGHNGPTEGTAHQGIGGVSEEGGLVDEHGYSAPILAPDEVAKEPGIEYLTPAVPPPLDRPASELHGGWEHEAQSASHSHRLSRTTSRDSSGSVSRANSRPTSMVGFGPGLSRLASAMDDRDGHGAPLEDVEEYEPLFPEDDHTDGEKVQGARATAALRPDILAQHKFPSQDIWEDAPSSAQLQATISTPALLEDDAQTVIADRDDEESPTSHFAADSAQREPAESATKTFDSQEVTGSEYAKLSFKPDVSDQLSDRPGMKQRFPSRDIWEDSPASLQLQTTVSVPETDEVRTPLEKIDEARDEPDAAGQTVDGGTESKAGKSPTEETSSSRPAVPPRPVKAKLGPLAESSGQPAVPPRPSRRVIRPVGDSSPVDNQAKTEQQPLSDRKPPLPPGKPKPQVPARSSNPATGDAAEGAPLAKITSAASRTSTSSAQDEAASPRDAPTPPASKPKPAVPARPSGGKIAALKAGFMSDLDKRLQLGPRSLKGPEKTVAVEPPETEKEPAPPLSDVRKGRARGPARRRPGTSPSKATQEAPPTDSVATPSYVITQPMIMWQITDDGGLLVAGSKQSEARSAEPSADTSGDTGALESIRSAAAPSSSPKNTAEDKDRSAQSSPGQDSTPTAVETANEKDAFLSSSSDATGLSHNMTPTTQESGSPREEDEQELLPTAHNHDATQQLGA